VLADQDAMQPPYPYTPNQSSSGTRRSTAAGDFADTRLSQDLHAYANSKLSQDLNEYQGGAAEEGAAEDGVGGFADASLRHDLKEYAQGLSLDLDSDGFYAEEDAAISEAAQDQNKAERSQSPEEEAGEGDGHGRAKVPHVQEAPKAHMWLRNFLQTPGRIVGRGG
jgi:hypothetical protein